MPKVTFVDPSGAHKRLKADVGYTLMEVATRNGVPGITADCGGACACATCHVYIDADSQMLLPPPDANEQAMLEFASDSRPNSRLSCQIKIEPKLEGLTVHIPKY
jgi:2Fe-2S ferredoxin